ncbi:hypothetical protein [Nocardioides insulae]|uniref:hypothetical protein n=1 Tax=Nocardioides insulae TaxID=394734 RepID=UPI00040C47CB|nr:hypothetical protein [Nocardioides insulae]
MGLGRVRGRRPEAARISVPDAFIGVAEVLAEGPAADGGVLAERCSITGGRLAEQGLSLAEALEQLRRTTSLMRGRDPSYDETCAVATGWSEATLSYLHGLSCADPLTGLATQAHLRERLSELYRSRPEHRSHALVVTEARITEPDRWRQARQMTLLGRHARSVFGGLETIGQVGRARLVVLAPRDELIAPRTSLLRRMADQLADRVWIEGLPGTDESAGRLLDELARS